MKVKSIKSEILFIGIQIGFEKRFKDFCRLFRFTKIVPRGCSYKIISPESENFFSTLKLVVKVQKSVKSALALQPMDRIANFHLPSENSFGQGLYFKDPSFKFPLI